MTTTLVNVQHDYTKQDMMPILLDRAYEISSSASTTTTNSPTIRSQFSELSCCPCNQLINSKYECADCQVSFPAIKQLHKEYNETKTQLNELKMQKADLRHDATTKEEQITQIAQDISEKLNIISVTKRGIESLQHDMTVLETKCKEETSQVIDIQESKENVKRELEDLSVKLFEEANSMIKIEKQEQALIKQKNELLTKELQHSEIDLKEASNELQFIRNSLQVTIHAEEQPIEEQEKKEDRIDTYTRAQVETILMHGLDLGLYMDTIEDDGCLLDFNDFLQQLHKTPLRKLHSLRYMKDCINDDIEPCLRFGPSPRLSSKKIMDAIMIKSCFIEECPPGFVTEQATKQLKEEATATLWERFTTSSVFLGCQACGRNMDKDSRQQLLKYRFRVSYFDEWACIDRYCRDRLLAVVEFYMFIRHLRAGQYKHRSLHELYQQSIRLRLQMFIARMGALPNMLQNCGINQEKIAAAFHGEDINHSIILSSANSSAIERLSSSSMESNNTIDFTRTSVLSNTSSNFTS